MKKIIILLAALALAASAWAQTRTITGTVKDSSDGTPVVGVSVVVKDKAGKMKGTTTNNAGKYSIQVTANDQEIAFSFIGMESITHKIDNRTTVNIEMKPEATTVETVVVESALGLKREAKAMPYSRQSVDSESLNEVRTPDFVSSLSGKVAGLMVAPPGQNTGSSGITLRGYSSATSDNNALFVVDGAIMENGAVGGERGGLDYGNAMGDINPADIATIEVLKGPNATALYGSRAANGVIMITTKGSSGKGFKVTFSNSSMFQKIVQYPEYQNTFGVGMDLDIQTSNTMTLPNPITGSRYRSWGPMMLGQPYIAIDGRERPYFPQPDNISDFYQHSSLITNTITIEGGSKESNMRLTYTNYNGNSVVAGVNRNIKHTFNLNASNKFTKWFTFNSRITYIRDNVKNRQYTNADSRNPVNSYVHMARSTSLDELRDYKDENGNEKSTNRNTSNPYWIINENPTEDTRDRLQGSFNATIQMPYGITLLGRASVDLYWWEGTTFQNLGGFYDPVGRVEEFTDFFSGVTLEGMATWKKNIRKIFSINAMAGASTNRRQSDRRTQTVIGLVQPSFLHISNATEKITPVQVLSDRKTNSVFGSLSVGYKGLLYLDATARNDWFSTLPVDNCSFFYPSAGLSFIFSELLKTGHASRIMPLGKVRLSYAKVGNDTSPYRISRDYTIGGIFNGAPYAVVSNTLNNENLKPEITHSFEAGLEMQFLSGRVGFDLTGYRASTYNQIVPAFVTATSGYERRIFNAGEIRNSGIEVSLKGEPVKNRKFTWSSMLNFSKNTSKVISLLEEYDVTSLTLYSASNTTVNVEVGKPYGYIRGVGVRRNEYGQMIMPDGASPSEFESDPSVGFGTASPDWLMGFNNAFTYKGFDFSFLIDVKYGGIMYCNTFSKMMTNGLTTVNYDGRVGYALSKQIYNESDTEMTHGIQWPNAVQRKYDENGNVIGYTPVTKYFSPSGYEYTRSSINEFSIFDASFVKLREVTLGYTFPRKWLNKTALSNVKLSVVARNAWIIYQKTPRGVDPESASTSGNGRGIENGSLPPVATFGFNISLSTK